MDSCRVRGLCYYLLAMPEEHYDIIVIGGGPAGMMAAGRAALRGRRVLLIEKNDELGKKLSITGGGRCNILNAENDTRTLLQHYGEAEQFLYSSFSQFGVQDTWDFFVSHGVPLKVEDRKRAFPVSEKAHDVTRALSSYLEENGVDSVCGATVREFVLERGVPVGVMTEKGVHKGDVFILASGGESHKETGSTGDGFKWLRDLGHTVHPPDPTLVPLVVKEGWVKKVSGRALSDARITFACDRSKEEGRYSVRGKILFTHFGLSGPSILNASNDVKTLLKEGDVKACISMYPDRDKGSVRKDTLSLFEGNKNKMVKNILKDLAPLGMSAVIAEVLPQELLERKVHSVTREERFQIVDTLTDLPLTITGTKGLDWAVISDGGVDLSEVDMRTFCSKYVPNVYLVGDLLNITRPSGGYSLQLCWTTGWVAGSHA